MGEVRNSHSILVGKPGKVRPFGGPKQTCTVFTQYMQKYKD